MMGQAIKQESRPPGPRAKDSQGEAAMMRQ
jgi:hypothetical protein